MMILKTDGSTEEREMKSDLESLQAIVGGYIEFYTFRDGSALVVNEEGKLRELPVNGAASALTVMKRQPDLIVGDCVFFSRDEMNKMREDERDDE